MSHPYKAKAQGGQSTALKRYASGGKTVPEIKADVEDKLAQLEVYKEALREAVAERQHPVLDEEE